MTRITRVIVYGRVQGVGYRNWTEHTARRLALEGWVRNRIDGTVEALFCGPGEVVTRVIAACRRGPQAARVERIEEFSAAESELLLRPAGEAFSQLPTV